MKNNRLKISLAAFGLLIALTVATTTVNAQAANWCRWDNLLMECNWTAQDGLCAVSGPNCDVPVVE